MHVYYLPKNDFLMTSLQCVGCCFIKKLDFLNKDERCDSAAANTMLSAPIPEEKKSKL